ncbi:MAG: 30S ribosomal protein S20 [Spirochaetes bacterium]|nr:30S ribosomal protein S20 [Spirochaetota bacterium]
MANNNSTKKRIRQAEKSRLFNSKVKSSIRTASKKVIKLITAKDTAKPEEILGAEKNFDSTIDSAARKNVVHWKKAARLKSRMAKKVNSAVK